MGKRSLAESIARKSFHHFDYDLTDCIYTYIKSRYIYIRSLAIDVSYPKVLLLFISHFTDSK